MISNAQLFNSSALPLLSYNDSNWYAGCLFPYTILLNLILFSKLQIFKSMKGLF